MYKLRLSVSGFTKAQIEEGLPHLLDEFGYRPWILESQAFFDKTTENLITIVGYEDDIRLEDRAFDEISDCIFATMNFDEKINIDIQRI